MDEVDLIRECKKGNLDAFSSLFEKYGRKAVRTVFLITGRSDIAEDIVQEAFIQCYLKIKKLRTPETFQAWFYRLLTRISWRYCSREKKHPRLENSDYPSRELFIDDFTLSEVIEAKEVKQLIGKALDKLSIPMKTTIILFYFNELSIREIAQVMGCFEGTAKSRLHNARKLLEKELQQKDFEGYLFRSIPIRKECNKNVNPGEV